MGSILEAIEDWIRVLLVSGIMSNLTNIFDSVNNQVGQIATEVGRTPASFSPAVYGMIRTLSENVIMPIAVLILTFIAYYEQIQLVIVHMAPYSGRVSGVKRPRCGASGHILNCSWLPFTGFIRDVKNARHNACS